MGRSAARTQFPESTARAIRSSKTTPTPRRAHRRRRIKNPSFPGGRRSPLPTWKLRDADRSRRPEEDEDVRGSAAAFSARTLAAALWHSQAAEVGSGGRLGFEPDPRHENFPDVGDHDRTALHASISNEFAGPRSTSRSRATMKKQHEVSGMFTNFALERTTKWEAGCSGSAEGIYHTFGHQKLLKDWLNTASVVSVLQAELEQAHCHINELERERQSAKEKLDHFLKKLGEEKASWQIDEHEKVRNIITSIKDDLNREKKSRKRMEILNSKLVNELAEAKLSAKQYLQSYEKEREARELIEEVCDELAKEIGDDKARVESLKRESTKIQEEVDEERKMLQMAEVWREERVQMKLVDAKLMLEEKYAELIKLQSDLDSFLESCHLTNANASSLKEAEVLNEVASSMKFQDVEILCQPPASGDFSVFDELKSRDDANERGIEKCYGYSPESHASRIHTVSPETDIFLESCMKVYANDMADRDEEIQDDGGLGIVRHAEGQGSCNSPKESDPSANGIHEESHASVSGTDWNLKSDASNLKSETSEICSGTTKQSRKKVPYIGKFWRSSCTSNSHNKKTPLDVSNGKLPNGGLSNATLSPETISGEAGLSSLSVEQRGSSDSIDPHVGRGTKGYVEWSRDTKNHSLKTKLLGMRMENQKVQLRHVLEHKS
ncbi:hypothetical protein MUK42_10994 [Musa troglodytarum]|uniref:Uncharacterized protein n=1 Tax=Musa troglodytarum TaxID=320322 RepID=A0A9E7GQ24_9LILI|nr:hypothetical protein MUK42_10994 [Musa troglodytarum]URE19637.1 hypothetical protein MUK42_10994 [Musa troglodytarum]